MTTKRHRVWSGRSAPALLWAAGAALLLAGGCGGDDGAGVPPELEGGVLATFEVEGERFRVWVTNPATIADLEALRDGRSTANIPNGPLLAGPGTGGHNAPWSWHLDPEETEMAEATIEVCSGLPSFVEENLSDWLALGRYCPWSARLESLEDFR
ncbi:MAG: hypothetical protein D6701_04300 [Gemmatimonadetes bacterium]|nr:MAG: hypothetical protein D6701_04300 [Gemmatimonadota bacterium]